MVGLRGGVLGASGVLLLSCSLVIDTSGLADGPCAGSACAADADAATPFHGNDGGSGTTGDVYVPGEDARALASDGGTQLGDRTTKPPGASVICFENGPDAAPSYCPSPNWLCCWGGATSSCLQVGSPLGGCAGYPIACDTNDDCAPGFSCCGRWTYDTEGGGRIGVGTGCVAQCPSDAHTYPMCERFSAPSGCGPGLSCQAAPDFPGYGACL
jgi:hypothetical protein